MDEPWMKAEEEKDENRGTRALYRKVNERKEKKESRKLPQYCRNWNVPPVGFHRPMEDASYFFIHLILSLSHVTMNHWLQITMDGKSR